MGENCQHCQAGISQIMRADGRGHQVRVYCSKVCRDRARTKRRKKNKPIRRREHGRFTLICIWCDKPFQAPRRGMAYYCSDAHKQALYRAQRAEQIPFAVRMQLRRFKSDNGFTPGVQARLKNEPGSPGALIDSVLGELRR